MACAKAATEDCSSTCDLVRFAASVAMFASRMLDSEAESLTIWDCARLIGIVQSVLSGTHRALRKAEALHRGRDIRDGLQRVGLRVDSVEADAQTAGVDNVGAAAQIDGDLGIRLRAAAANIDA